MNAEPIPSAAASALPWKRLAAAALSGLPYFLVLPYVVSAWTKSPLDSWDWIYLTGFVLLMACGAPAVSESAAKNKMDWFALLLITAAAGVYGFGWVKHTYFIRILSSIWLWWGGVWLFCGWKAAWFQLPAFGTLSLGCTSSTFLLCNFFLMTPTAARFVKIGGLMLCAILCAVLILSEFVLKRDVFWFLLAAAAILGGSVFARGGKTAAPFRPGFDSVEGFQRIEHPLSADSIRFFEGAKARQFQFTDDIFSCSVLEVKCGGDIHKIHPASHCLRSGGAEIISEQAAEYTLSDGRILPVTEILAKRGTLPLLAIVWYTGPKETTGSFFLFRQKWSTTAQWYSYQVVTTIYNGNQEAARAFLTRFLSTLPPSALPED